MTVPNEFAARLSAAITHSGYSQNELAYALKTAPARVSEWRNGRSVPHLTFLTGLCNVLEVSGHWLLTGQGQMQLNEADQRVGHLETLLEISRLCQRGILNENEIAAAATRDRAIAIKSNEHRAS